MDSLCESGRGCDTSLASWLFHLHLLSLIAWPTELSFEDNSSLNPGNSILYCALNEVSEHFLRMLSSPFSKAILL